MKRRSRRCEATVVALLALGLAAGLPGTWAQERKITVAASDLPEVIREAIQKAFPGDRILIIEKEVEGEDPGQYDVVIQSGDKQYEVEIAPDGRIIETKERAIAQGGTNTEAGKKWTDSFGQEACSFSSLGRNSYSILIPGHQLTLESPEEKVVITVLNETKMIGNVETRVVEEREEENGELKEVSRNFFATCREHGDVFYFGEEVDDYDQGKIVGHGGAWRADEPGSKAGILMPGTILLGARHYQEIAPNAMDRAEIIANDVTLATPAGIFHHCVRVEETSGLDPDEKCYKTYAPGIGLIQDEDLLLVSYRVAEREEKVAPRDLPPAVRRALRRHLAGGKVVEIEKEIVAGTVVYEAEIVRDGKEFDIRISATGEYLGTEPDDDVKDADDDQKED
ncbi:MAG: PepSY-like domain-containing protein [Phycisphaerales bacterium]|nr:MAG: PepSY-like domain-containing protein [Phycisphaerales bacterium]